MLTPVKYCDHFELSGGIENKFGSSITFSIFYTSPSLVYFKEKKSNILRTCRNLSLGTLMIPDRSITDIV